MDLTVFATYRPLLAVPGARRFIAGATICRVAGAMFGVAVVVMVSSRRGSYGLAGAVSALGLVSLAIAGPLLSRLIDQRGQRRVALPFLISSALFGLVMVACSWWGAPTWTLFASYAVSAFLPELGPLSRARWAHLLGDDPDRLHTAFSMEQVLDEFGYVVGPVVAVSASTLLFPEAGLLIAVLGYAVGGLVFLSERSTEPPATTRDHRPAGFALTRPGVATVALILTMTGVIFGANEVVAVAVAEHAGRESFSSIVLAAFALGSMVAGLMFGARTLTRSLAGWLAVTTALMALLEIPALFASNLWVLTAVMLIAGCATAPTLITAMGLTQRLVPAGQVTEGMAVLVTGILIGISAGAAASGWVVDRVGPQQGYLVPVVAGLVAAVAATGVHHRLRRLEKDAAGRSAGPGH